LHRQYASGQARLYSRRPPAFQRELSFLWLQQKWLAYRASTIAPSAQCDEHDFRNDEQPIWRRLAIRATLLGLGLPEEPETTSDPALHVVIRGRVIKPVCVDAKHYTFVLPRADGPVRLVSRIVWPSEARPWVEDHRRLGVAVSRLTLKHGPHVEPIPLDHPRLSEGWWAAEHDHATHWRWTDGDAVIPLPDVGPAVLDITLASSLEYPIGGVVETSEVHASGRFVTCSAVA